MSFIREISSKLLNELSIACKDVWSFLLRVWKVVSPYISKFWKTCSDIFEDFIAKLKDVSFRKRAFVGMTFFLIAFFLWQIFAYSLTQTVFVIVNLLFVTIASIMICVIIVSTQRSVREVRGLLEAAETFKKKKEKEISSLKKEIHDYKIAAKNQTTFGKNSQALIDSVKKNKLEQREGEGRGQYILRSIALHYEVCCGLIYMKNQETEQFDLSGQFALTDDPKYTSINEQDGIAGLAISTGKVQSWADIPEDYISVSSGLGQSNKLQLYVLPLKKNGKVEAVIEVASFGKLVLADIWSDIDNLLLNE